MTAITVPPLIPLYPDSGADLFATFGVSGNPLSGSSLVGLKSSGMTPVVAFAEQSAFAGSASPLATFSAIPKSGILIGRMPALTSAPSASFIYHMDGRKIRNAVGSPASPTFLNAYFDGRALIRTPTAISTIDPTTLVAKSNDVTFASSGNSTIGTSDTAGYVAAVLSGPTLNFWNPAGALLWSVSITPTAPNTSIAPTQLEFGPSGQIYMMATQAGTSRPGCMRKYDRSGGSMLFEVLWSLNLATLQLLALWVAKDETLFITRSGNTPASGAGTLGPFAESYSSGGSLNWSTPLWTIGGPAFGSTSVGPRTGGVCEINGTIYAAMIPFGGHTGSPPITPAGANVTQLNRSTGAIVATFSVGAITSQDCPYWLEPRSGRIGTFGG